MPEKAGVATVFVGPGRLSRWLSSPLVTVRSRHRLFLTRRGMCFALLSSGLTLLSDTTEHKHELSADANFPQRVRQRLEGFGCRGRAYPVCVSPALLFALPPHQDPSIKTHKTRSCDRSRSLPVHQDCIHQEPEDTCDDPCLLFLSFASVLHIKIHPSRHTRLARVIALCVCIKIHSFASVLVLALWRRRWSSRDTSRWPTGFAQKPGKTDEFLSSQPCVRVYGSCSHPPAVVVILSPLSRVVEAALVVARYFTVADGLCPEARENR